MGRITEIPFEMQDPAIKDHVVSYWSKRAESFAKLRRDEITSYKAERWLSEIRHLLPKDRPRQLRILDVGCGAGFFEIILGREGHLVTGIDLTPAMAAEANALIDEFGLDRSKVSAQVMDGEHPDFPDETFDLVISRNLTWTLPHPLTAYKEWYRVLKKGGVLLNFDAEYARHAHKNLYSPENLSHKDISDQLKDECHQIYHELTVSALYRPEWDLEAFKEIGFPHYYCDPFFGDRVYKEMDEFHMPDRMFSLRAIK